ncbi:hypothetical protein OY671_011129, partial [Metschnikowia pulcherrima]
MTEMTYDNAQDYSIRAQEASHNFGGVEARKEATRQFSDEKSFKPGLGTFDASKPAFWAKEKLLLPQPVEASVRARRSRLFMSIIRTALVSASAVMASSAASVSTSAKEATHPQAEAQALDSSMKSIAIRS